LELQSSIQGHPDARANWQEKVNVTLTGMEWNRTKHESCLYHREVKDAPDQLMCRQVDDMLLAIKAEEDYQEIMQYVRTGDNSADAMTKALGWVLHNKHAFKSMDLYGNSYSKGGIQACFQVNCNQICLVHRSHQERKNIRASLFY